MDYAAAHRRTKGRGERQKSQVGNGRLIRKAESGHETGKTRRLTAVIMSRSTKEDGTIPVTDNVRALHAVSLDR